MSGCAKIPARTLFSLAFLAVVAPASAQQAAQAREHTVRRGETLWGIAGVYYSNHFLWPVIYEANREVVRDPHWIYPDQRLAIPGVEGGLPVAVQPEGEQPMITEAMGPRANSGRTRFYVPTPPPNRDRDIALINRREPLYAVPPAEYLSAPWLADSSSLGIRARLAGMADPSRQSDRLPARLLPYDRVLASWIRGAPAGRGDSLMVVRIEGPVADLGNVIVPVALVRVDSVGADVMRLEIINQFADALVGDHVIPVEPVPPMRRGEPQPAENGAEGRLVRFLESEPLYGTQDRGFVDVGGSDGLSVGDELIAFVEARRGARDTELPPEVIATLRVVKVRDASATVRVTDAFGTALREGIAVRVVKRMQ
ncbi:MAG: LysM peptidoglycan-binding domain-containing protein [Gemmatimonadetes bacterium]|nr:LysM peptidoglycan-binding domain-containing protein [Gemmatimonadota bacterium]